MAANKWGFFTGSEGFPPTREIFGFSDEEVASWKYKKVLEVGPGKGRALFELLAAGIDVIAIEPGLRFDRLKNRLVKAYRKKSFSFAIRSPIQFLRVMKSLRNRVSSAEASRAVSHPLMPENGVDVIFAFGANFQNYANSRDHFINSLRGLIECLSQEGFLTFSIDSDRDFFLVNQKEKFDLVEFLQNIGAKFEVCESDVGMYVVRIFRFDEDGNDLLDSL